MPTANESQLNNDLHARYAANAMRAAQGNLTSTQAQTLFIASTRLLALSRDVEHAAFMLHKDAMECAPSPDTDFIEQAVQRLGQMKEQMIYIGTVLRGDS